MTNDFSKIPAEGNLRSKITVRSDEYDPATNPAYDGPMGIFTDYDWCDSDPDDDKTEDEDKDLEPDESMDGDFDSGMASAGMGTDEDYGYHGEEE